MTIAIEGLSFSYGKRTALKDISLTLETGRFNALLGPNGAGKSTLYALLTRLFALQSGSISIAGHNITKHPAQVMQQLGVVFQQSTLDLDLTVGQNLRYHAALHGMSGRQAAPRISEELQRLQLEDRINDRVRSLNGGHRRRVEIARALLHKPSVLLLDEASVGLDAASRESLNQHVRSLCREHSLTVLWATHLIEELDLDDPVTILNRGEIKATGIGRTLLQQHPCESIADLYHQLTGEQT